MKTDWGERDRTALAIVPQAIGLKHLRATGRTSPWLRVAAVVGIASMILVIALASWTEIGGLALLLLISTLVYGLRLLRLKPVAAQ